MTATWHHVETRAPNSPTTSAPAHGDVKIHDIAEPVGDRYVRGTPDVGPDAELFDIDLTRIATIAVDDDHIAIRTWIPGQPVRTRTRT